MAAIPQQIEFSVDSALLKELGERLVGKAHIALAELVKNSYDADATKVEINFDADEIEIRDNGHGMTFEEFQKFWMRVGSPHKQITPYSRELGRPITGSKGVGRLAVQFLADTMELVTAPKISNGKEIVANVDWNEAVKAKELTKAIALWHDVPLQTDFPGGSEHGTIIRLTGLHQTWTGEELENLAREIWVLQPPFKRDSLTDDDARAFSVEVCSADQDAVQTFEDQMEVGLSQWIAKISGRTRRDETSSNTAYVDVIVEFVDGTKSKYSQKLTPCRIFEADFEIRIFRLTGKQKGGIRVTDARDYMSKYGGVHVYDAGFHLPYYGPDQDWLGIERDHAARLTNSQLLPDELQVDRGMQMLPTQRRIFGVVNINTGRERDLARKREKKFDENSIDEQIRADDFLKIQVTRDRLVDNGAYQDLKKAVRIAIDFYAIEAQRRNQKDKLAIEKTVPISERFEKIADVLDYYQNDIPEAVFSDLSRELKKAAFETESEAEAMVRRTSLLGTLATAGISALSHQHEIDKQLTVLEGITKDFLRVKTTDSAVKEQLKDMSERINEWLERSRATRNLFSFMMDQENRTIRQRFNAKRLLRQVTDQMGVLLRGIDIDTNSLADNLLLPIGSFAEWSSVFQNVLLNAVAAMLDGWETEVTISSRVIGKKRQILIQDKGSGVDLASASELFEPFVRKLELSTESRSLGFGGSGLGLTIVKMLATNLDAKVSFVEPDEDFSTAFRLEWTEE